MKEILYVIYIISKSHGPRFYYNKNYFRSWRSKFSYNFSIKHCKNIWCNFQKIKKYTSTSSYQRQKSDLFLNRKDYNIYKYHTHFRFNFFQATGVNFVRSTFHILILNTSENSSIDSDIFLAVWGSKYINFLSIIIFHLYFLGQ